MSQPRRRRRRRRRKPGSTPAGEQSQTPAARSQGGAGGDGQGGPSPGSRRRRRRRRGARSAPERPETLEDIERSIKPPVPAELTAPPDGQTLEELIGDLQSVWGVPQYPQEYRITVKVAEERGSSAPAPARANGEDGVQREKAPAAPRMGAAASDPARKPKRERAPRRRRGSRRGRRRSGDS